MVGEHPVSGTQTYPRRGFLFVGGRFPGLLEFVLDTNVGELAVACLLFEFRSWW